MDFSDIAYAKFLQTWPELSSLLLTFQDMSEELGDDTDVKVGIFVLRSGADLLYVPVVAKGEGLMPIDSIFFNSKSKFFPLTKKTVEVIINANGQGLGHPAKIPATVPQNPNLRKLVDPPRTGKFSYASASRLTDFLTGMPNEIKDFVLEKIAADPKIYNGLNDMFGLENIFNALKHSYDIPARPQDRGVGVPGISVIQSGSNLPTPIINSILTNGYAIAGENALTRVAIPATDWKANRFRGMSSMDAGYDYDVVLKSGSTQLGFLPMRVVSFMMPLKTNANSNTNDGFQYKGMLPAPSFVMYCDGTYSLTPGTVIQGEAYNNKQVLKDIFEVQPPVMLRDIETYSKVALFDQNMGLICALRANRLVKNQDGIIVYGTCLLSDTSLIIHAYRGYAKAAMYKDGEVYVSYACLAVVLGEDISDQVETAIHQASFKQDLIEWGLLNDSMNLSFDNVEFHVNGHPIGGEPKIMEVLVVKEGIHPDQAKNFVKQAKEQKHLTIYLSKKADSDFNTTDGGIPQFGQEPPAQINPLGKGSNFMPNLQRSMQTEDPQTVENTLISELLQSPDMFSMISEYLPDIEEGIDRLGRILLLGRINLSKLGEENNADDVFDFMSQLNNVFKSMGETFIKLERFSNNASQAE